MALLPGASIGPYRVVAPLGAGGMGEVYRARDLRLDREVAIKVLPASFASDVDRVMRFGREAKALASLNHPHIAQVLASRRFATVRLRPWPGPHDGAHRRPTRYTSLYPPLEPGALVAGSIDGSLGRPWEAARADAF